MYVAYEHKKAYSLPFTLNAQLKQQLKLFLVN